MNRASVAVLGWCLLAAANAGPPELATAWETTGLKEPESVLYDPVREVLYVSNIDGGPSDRDGKGSIARVSLTGELLDAAWIQGLDAPKGLARVGDLLYVADLDGLVKIDLTSGTIVRRYVEPAARFINDVAADAGGRVYVSDMQGASIYRLANEQWERWLASDKRSLCSPNGLYAAADYLVVGCWSRVVDEFETVEPGFLKTVDYDSRAIGVLGEPVALGHIDGVEGDGRGGYYLTDWLAGKLIHVDDQGAASTLLELEQGAADLEVIPERGLIVIPLMNDGRVRAYRRVDES